MEIVVDANVWLSAAGPHEPSHAASISFLREALACRLAFLLPALILPEVAGTAARRTRREQDGCALVQHLRQLPNVTFFELDLRRAEEAARLAGRLFLRGADAQYAALAFERHAPLVTLDRELCTRAAGTIDCLTPEAWLVRLGAG